MRNSASRLLGGLAAMLVSGTALAAPQTLTQQTGGYRIDLRVGSADHQLAVSVLDEKTGQPVTDADLGLYSQVLDRNGGRDL